MHSFAKDMQHSLVRSNVLVAYEFNFQLQHLNMALNSLMKSLIKKKIYINLWLKFSLEFFLICKSNEQNQKLNVITETFYMNFKCGFM